MPDTGDPSIDAEIEPIRSGIPALDSLLNGGYVRGRTYLVQGVPGTGKSMLGQHFLEAGIEADETVVYIHGEESKRDIITNATQLSIDISDAEFLGIGPGTEFFDEDISYELIDTADIESERFTKDIKHVIETVSPDRVLIDPITQIQYIERDAYQYRKRLQSLIQILRNQQVTTVATRTVSRGPAQEFAYDDFESLSDGVIKLYLNDDERRISVLKHRGLGQKDGTHGLEIRANGIEVYPQTIPGDTDQTPEHALLSTGDPALDGLLGGGLERGSVSFVSGPTGIGKSTLGAQLLTAISESDGTVLGYLFEESIEQFTYRCEKLGLPISEFREEGSLHLTAIEPLVQSAEEFGQHVISEAEQYDPDAVLIDGIAGYKISLQGDDQRLVRRLHGLTRSLKNHDIAVVITDEADALTGVPKATSTNTSYIADTVVFLSYVEIDGDLRRAIGILKKRLGDFDTRFHQFSIVDGSGIEIEGPFDGVHGIMQGVPVRNNRSG